jgi:hypothetical protein
MPPTVKIFGVDYGVFEVTTKQLYERPEHAEVGAKQALDKVIGPSGRWFGGLCDGHNCNLFMNKSIRTQKRKKIFIHEVLEGIDQEAVLGLKHNQIEQIANGLLMAGLVKTEGFVTEDGKKKRKKRTSKTGKPKTSDRLS